MILLLVLAPVLKLIAPPVVKVPSCLTQLVSTTLLEVLTTGFAGA